MSSRARESSVASCGGAYDRLLRPNPQVYAPLHLQGRVLSCVLLCRDENMCHDLLGIRKTSISSPHMSNCSFSASKPVDQNIGANRETQICTSIRMSADHLL